MCTNCQIRDQKESSAGHVATKLEQFTKSYPADLQTNYNRPSPRATIVPVSRVRRLARFHSKDLIASAGTWEVAHSSFWPSLFPLPSVSSESALAPAIGPTYTSRYRGLLHITDDEADEAEPEMIQRFRNMHEKEWTVFKDLGFSPANNDRLKFDLRESERTGRRAKHSTMDWSTSSLEVM